VSKNAWQFIIQNTWGKDRTISEDREDRYQKKKKRKKKKKKKKNSHRRKGTQRILTQLGIHQTSARSPDRMGLVSQVKERWPDYIWKTSCQRKEMNKKKKQKKCFLPRGCKKPVEEPKRKMAKVMVYEGDLHRNRKRPHGRRIAHH